MKNIASVILLLSISFNIFSQKKYIEDETNSNPDFQLFAEKLQKAIDETDTTVLFDLMANEIKVENGTLISKDEFIESTGIRMKGANANFWKNTNSLLEMGFHKNNKTKSFVSPSYLKKHKNKDEYVYVYLDQVNIHRHAFESSEIMRQVGYQHLLYYTDKNPENSDWPKVSSSDKIQIKSGKWVQVQLKDGEFGFIDFRSTSLYHRRAMAVAKVDGVWKIIAYCKPNVI